MSVIGRPSISTSTSRVGEPGEDRKRQKKEKRQTKKTWLHVPCYSNHGIWFAWAGTDNPERRHGWASADHRPLSGFSSVQMKIDVAVASPTNFAVHADSTAPDGPVPSTLRDPACGRATLSFPPATVSAPFDTDASLYILLTSLPGAAPVAAHPHRRRRSPLYTCHALFYDRDILASRCFRCHCTAPPPIETVPHHHAPRASSLRCAFE